MKSRYTFEYFIHALLLIFLGIVSVFAHYFVAIILAFLAVLFLLIKSGIEIDFKNNRIRNYTELLGLRFGKWFNINGLQRIDLRYTSESQTIKSLVHTDSLHTKTFDLFLMFESQKEIEIGSFKDYHSALGVLEELSQELNVSSKDWIRELREQAFENRKSRRR